MILPDTLLHFLSALGYSVLNSFWQTGLLWLLIIALSKYKPHLTPAVLSNLSFAALVTGFVAFITTLLVYFYAPQASLALPGFLARTGFSEILTITSAGLYLLLLIIPGFKLFTGFNEVRNLKTKELSRPPSRYKIFMLDMASYLGIKKKVRLFTSALAETPLTIGFLKPVILLPVAVINNLTPGQVETIILHELAHIKKHDYVLNLIGCIISTVLYFNPFAKALMSIYKVEREKTADGSVLQFEYDSHLFANTLLHVAQSAKADNGLLTMKAAGENQHLYHRIQWMVGIRQRPLPGYKKVFALAAFMSLFLLINPASRIQKSPQPVASLTNANISPIFTLSYDHAISVQPIPVKPEIKMQTVYLKKVENAETGKIEIVMPAAQEEVGSQYLLVTKPDIPYLTPRQEENVQQILTAAKKIFAEENWRLIELSLAETVTGEQKTALKEAFTAMIEASDWNQKADAMRQAYDDIDWKTLLQDINMAVAYIRLDSIYNSYNTALERYHQIKKEIGKEKQQEINTLIADTENILNVADSIRRKRVVEL